MKDLTYRVSKYPVGGLTTEEVDKTVAQALKLWSDITELTFSRKDTGQVHMRPNIVCISFSGIKAYQQYLIRYTLTLASTGTIMGTATPLTDEGEL